MQTRRLPAARRRWSALPDDPRFAVLGALTPLGELALTGRWAALALAAWRDRG